jgi:hypothetical protein
LRLDDVWRLSRANYRERRPSYSSIRLAGIRLW